jgi:hypothetical protein
VTLCYAFPRMLQLGESRTSFEDDDEPAPEIAVDPDRGFKRLLFAILLQSLSDFTGAQDLQVHNQARAFLFPKSADHAKHLTLLIEGAGINPAWFAERCERLRQRTAVPEGKVTLNRFATKERARQRCQSA